MTLDARPRRLYNQAVARDEENSADEATWRRALREFAAEVREKFGGAVERVILYGSRARGDDAPDSDVDVIVFLAEGTDLVEARGALSDLACDVAARYGFPFLIQALAYTEESFRRRASYFFIKNVKKEGVPI
ncbi:MAG TPA: nucleotidyltransferase domain-containing protein [bacterium]|nr:nucleotidyltransferase domain-containing protein [bacterium]